MLPKRNKKVKGFSETRRSNTDCIGSVMAGKLRVNYLKHELSKFGIYEKSGHNSHFYFHGYCTSNHNKSSRVK